MEEIKKKLHFLANNCYVFLKDGTVIENYLQIPKDSYSFIISFNYISTRFVYINKY